MTSPNHDTATGPRPASRSNPIVVTLLIVIAILLAVIAIILAIRPDRSSAEVPATAEAPATASAQASGVQTAAPSQTDPDLLAILHGEVKRDPADAQAKGDVDAPVVMVIYSDFACPYCTLFAQEVDPALEDLVEDGTLRVEWRDLAQITETSPLAAQAGIAAGNQGKFWEFHDAVYAATDPSEHPEYTEDSLVALAEQAGVPDLDQFRTDMNAAETVQAVADAKQHAYDLGIKGTPFFIVNDAYVSGYAPEDYMRATILEQAVAAGGGATPAP
ncbi:MULTISPECIES: thioredoxin domain-containing protein [unclassified Actinomyces]|uniref:DsbA family protein n=1 Tax=unclassified Actinomyces TaxID=2609248 RepID=UPI000D59B0C5|nr:MULTISPECIES: thioredoxin domain-containing protein [unclassified Actinomyces]RAX21751.1 thioredoxin [Actinomyces sp. Z5]RAX22573.1 thioredoxin [Actinomyces sp. Z3]